MRYMFGYVIFILLLLPFSSGQWVRPTASGSASPGGVFTWFGAFNVSDNITSPKYCIGLDCITSWASVGADGNNYTSSISFNYTSSAATLNLKRVGMSNLSATFPFPAFSETHTNATQNNTCDWDVDIINMPGDFSDGVDNEGSNWYPTAGSCTNDTTQHNCTISGSGMPSFWFTLADTGIYPVSVSISGTSTKNYTVLLSNGTYIWATAVDIDTDTFNTSTDFRNAVNNSGQYNISINASNVLNAPWLTSYTESDPQVESITANQFCVGNTTGTGIRCNYTGYLDADGVDSTGITIIPTSYINTSNSSWVNSVETDPQVVSLSSNQWCRANSTGTGINCDVAPVTDTDTNTYPTLVAVTGTATKNATLTLNNGTVLWGTFADIDTDTNTNCSVANSCSGIVYSGNTSWVTGAESDPQVQVTTAGQWCQGNGTAVTCNVSAITATGTGNLTGSGVAGWLASWTNASNLNRSSIYDDGLNVNISANLNIGNGASAGSFSNVSGWLQANVTNGFKIDRGLVVVETANATQFYMGGLLVATQSWVGSQGYLTSIPGSYLNTSNQSYIRGTVNGSGEYNIQIDASDILNEPWLESYTESDPQVEAITTGKWCMGNSTGTGIVCNQDAPSATGDGTGGWTNTTTNTSTALNVSIGRGFYLNDDINGSYPSITAGLNPDNEKSITLRTTQSADFYLGNSGYFNIYNNVGSWIFYVSNAGAVTTRSYGTAANWYQAYTRTAASVTSGNFCAGNGTGINCNYTGYLDADGVDTDTDDQTCAEVADCVVGALTSESDPQVQLTTAGSFCAGNGTAATCNYTGYLDSDGVDSGITAIPGTYINTSNATWIQAQELDASHDTCAEIGGCVVGAITDGNTGWDNIANYVSNLTMNNTCNWNVDLINIPANLDTDITNDINTTSTWTGGDLAGTGLAATVIDSSHLHHSQNITNSQWLNLTGNNATITGPFIVALDTTIRFGNATGMSIRFNSTTGALEIG